jgi:hypothetical protein
LSSRSCRRPSAPFSWKSLHRPAAGSDVLCRPLARPRVFPPRRPSPLRTRRHASRKPASQARVHRAPVRATPCVRTRTPLIGSTPPCGEVGRVEPTESQVLSRPEHPFTTYRHPPCQGDGLLQPATHALPPIPKHRRSFVRRYLSPISAADLLSRASAETPHSQASGSHLSDRRNLSRASTRANARGSTRHRPRRRRIAGAGIFDPGWRRSWCCASSRCQLPRPEGLARCPEHPDRASVMSRTRSRRADFQAPLSPPLASPGIPGSVPAGQDHPHRAIHQDHTDWEGPRCLPPIGPIDHAPRLRLDRSFPGRHWYPDLAAESPASDMLSRPAPPSARPKPLAGFHRSAWATCRLPTSATERPPNTPTNCPNPVA